MICPVTQTLKLSAKNFLYALPERLTRVTTGGKLIKEVDGLRFLAIFPVVVQHISERMMRQSIINFQPGREYDFTLYLTNRGFIGVYIFFILSGFILGMPFASHYLHGDRKVSLRAYFWRRLTRLEPPYIIVMTIGAIALVIMGMYSAGEMFPHYLASIVYLHSILFQTWSYINPPVWSLEIEVQFYILAPFLALLFFRVRDKVRRRIAFIVVIIAMMIAQQYMRAVLDITRLTILGHLHLFLIGFILVDIYLTEWKQGIPKSIFFDLLSIAGLISAILIWSWDHHFINRLGFAISLFVLVYSVFRATWVNGLVTLPWITAIGGMCYTIYLIHLPLIEFFIRITKYIVVTDSLTVNFIIQFCLISPFVLLFSIIFFLAIEKPCMDKEWPKQLKNYIFGKLGIVTT